MATVREVLARKAQQRPATLTVEAAATVRDAVDIMVEHGIAGVPIVRDGALVGIFTERDLLRRVVAAGLDPLLTAVADVMTHPVVTAAPGTPIDECGAVMSGRRLRHLPVLDGDTIVGMVTIGDVLAQRVDEQEHTIADLNRYVFDMR
jgi:CBS domain-containing protein